MSAVPSVFGRFVRIDPVARSMYHISRYVPRNQANQRIRADRGGAEGSVLAFVAGGVNLVLWDSRSRVVESV